MNTFRSVFHYERKGFFSTRNSVIIGLLLLLSVGFVLYGVSDYKKRLEQEKTFKDLEKFKVSRFLNYRQYCSYGIRVLFSPHPLSIFFVNSVPVSDMTSHIDSGMSLKIFKPLKGKNMFEVRKNWFADFSGIHVYLFLLLALLYGYECFLNKEYTKFLASVAGKRKLFVYMLLSRALLLISLLFFIMSLSVAVIYLERIELPLNKYLLIFFLMLVLKSLFFLILGAVFSSNKTVLSGMANALIYWFILVFIIPGALNMYMAKRADAIESELQLDKEKFIIVMDFENDSSKKEGNLPTGKSPSDMDRELVKKYLKNGFKRIIELEKEMIRQMKENNSLYHGLSVIFPTTAYDAVVNEISSKGYMNMIAFYEHMNATKEEFFKFYMDKVYFSNFTGMESFIKADENVFKGRPRLPEFFEWMVFAMITWSIILLIVAYFNYRRSLFSLPNKDKDAGKEDNVVFKSEESRGFNITGDLFKNQLYNIFHGESNSFLKAGYSYAVSLDGLDLTARVKQQDFLYLCRPKHFPGHTRIRNFLDFVMNVFCLPDREREKINADYRLETFALKKLKKLSLEELGNLMLAVLSSARSKIFLVNDTSKDMPIEFALRLKDKMDDLSDRGALVIYLYTETYFWRKDARNNYFKDSFNWFETVENFRNIPKKDEGDGKKDNEKEKK